MTIYLLGAMQPCLARHSSWYCKLLGNKKTTKQNTLHSSRTEVISKPKVFEQANYEFNTTVECHYNMILHTALQWLRQDINPESEPTEDTPYLTLTGDLWHIFCEHFGENWPHYNGTPLYHFPFHRVIYNKPQYMYKCINLLMYDWSRIWSFIL